MKQTTYFVALNQKLKMFSGLLYKIVCVATTLKDLYNSCVKKINAKILFYT